jgi:hypothetical protein
MVENYNLEKFEFNLEKIRAYGKSIAMGTPKDDLDVISEEEASFMDFDCRPLKFKSTNEELRKLREKFQPNDKRPIESIEMVDEYMRKGVLSHKSFGGLGGGECELLLYSPRKGNSYQISELVKDSKEYSNIPPLGYFGQPGVGWMNINDVIGPGVQTYQNHSFEERKFVYTGHKPNQFKYFPGKELLENEKFLQKETGNSSG